jgi:DNA-binding CsgD family transcriptional regulator
MRANSFSELTVIAAVQVRRLGFDNFLYGVQMSRASGPLPQFLMRGTLADWRAHYEAQGYDRVDPLVSYSAMHYVPMLWNGTDYDDPNALAMYQEGLAFGIKSGLVFPMHGPNIKIAYINLISSEPTIGHKFDQIATLGSAQLLACYLHEAFQKLENLVAVSEFDNRPLSRREIQCLQWSAEGKTSLEIARILALSERTIVFHLTNAALKLGAVNRRQAVVRAMALGLIVA